MKTIEERVKEAEEKWKKLRARQQLHDAQIRQKKDKKRRQDDTRRKILVGAFVIEQMERTGVGVPLVTYEGKRLGEWLKRPEDRALFGLPPLFEAPATQPRGDADA